MGETIREAFALWLWDKLGAQGWFVSDFARKVGVQRSAVYRWTAGQRTPTDSQIEKIADVLQVSREEIWNELARAGIELIASTSQRPTVAFSPRPPRTERQFASWIRAQLSERGWSAGHLARQLDLDVVTVRAWLTGLRTPASVQFPRIAEIFGVEPEHVRELTEI